MEKYKKMIRNSNHVKEDTKKKLNSRGNRSKGIRRTPSRDIVKRATPPTSNTRSTPTRTIPRANGSNGIRRAPTHTSPRTSDTRHTSSRATPRTSDTRHTSPRLSPLQRDSRHSQTIIVPTTTPYVSPRHSPRQTQNPVITANFTIDGQNLEDTQNTAVDQRTMLLQEKRKPFRNTRKYFTEAFRQIGMKKKKEAEKEKKTEIFAPSEEPLFKPKPPGEPIWTKDQDRETEKPVYMRFYSPTKQRFYYKHINSGLIGWNLVKLRDEVREMGFVGGGKLYKKAKKSKKAKKVKKVKKDKKRKKSKKSKKSKKGKK